jgi:hypothetical protein
LFGKQIKHIKKTIIIEMNDQGKRKTTRTRGDEKIDDA